MAEDRDAEEGEPTAAEFANWLRPRAALALRSSLTDNSAVDVLLTRLKAHKIRCFAAHGRWTFDGVLSEPELVPFPEGWWDRVKVANAFELFWTAPVSDLTVVGGRSGNPIYFLDVRFEPLAVRAAFGLPDLDSPAPHHHPSESPSDKRPKIDRRTLKAWVAQFGTSHPGAPFGKILAGARAAFPGFRVGERPVKTAIAELEMTRSVGNPSILRK
jgi:hypothetical protein